MRIRMDYGLDRVEFEVADANWIPGPQPPAALPDAVAAIRAALETPHGYPALRRALTSDDRVAIVVDEQLPRLAELLTPLLEHVAAAGVSPQAMTLLCPPSSSRQEWIEDLPDAFEDVHVEVHDPADRRRLAYVATTPKDKRLYLNRTLVEADQSVILSGRRYDPLLGYSGAEGSLYPALSDRETSDEMSHRVHLKPPDEKPWRVRREATEAAWLLGAPFFVQVIEAAGDALAHVVGGTADASDEGRRLLDSCWRYVAPRAADLVVAGLSGDPSRHTFAALAAALANAARVVRSGGRIVLLSRANPNLGPEIDLLRNADDPQTVLDHLRGKQAVELVPILQWAGAASHANINLLSSLSDDVAEELFATPLRDAGEAQRLLNASGSCLFLPDAHKLMTARGSEE